MMYAKVQDDLVVQLGGLIDGLQLPADLEHTPVEHLRHINGEIIDASSYSGPWYIDEFGRKRVSQVSAAWPEIDCAFAEVLLRDGATWRIETDADRLAVAIASARASIDTDAEKERLKYITAGYGQMLTYSQKSDEAKAYVNDANPDPADYPLLAAEIGVTGATLADVAAAVTASYTQWQAIGSAIEQTRLAAKKAVSEAPDEAAVKAVLDGIAWPDPQVPA